MAKKPLKESLIQLMPGSTGGWMAFLALLLALVNITAQQWGFTHADRETVAVWRDVIWFSLGIHTARGITESGVSNAIRAIEDAQRLVCRQEGG